MVWRNSGPSWNTTKMLRNWTSTQFLRDTCLNSRQLKTSASLNLNSMKCFKVLAVSTDQSSSIVIVVSLKVKESLLLATPNITAQTQPLQTGVITLDISKTTLPPPTQLLVAMPTTTTSHNTNQTQITTTVVVLVPLVLELFAFAVVLLEINHKSFAELEAEMNWTEYKQSSPHQQQPHRLHHLLTKNRKVRSEFFLNWEFYLHNIFIFLFLLKLKTFNFFIIFK